MIRDQCDRKDEEPVRHKERDGVPQTNTTKETDLGKGREGRQE